MRHAPPYGPMGLARRRWLMQAGAATVLVMTGLRTAGAGMGISGYTV